MSHNRRDEEASPLLAGVSQPQEDCSQKWNRIRREYRVHFGAGWITTIAVTALITYLWNAKKEFPPDICTSDRERTSAIILSVFFGSLGADRFYLGYVLLGALKLITGGLGGIWWTVDLVLLAMNAITDKNGCRLV
ncbi:uncharacterized protein ATC70_010814 [Mucor velutinosus]|uniref:TM2 domain-containing protein n=1 Tax=Mucor velutinosus TaxID=708070 RepID=A0AAN7I0M0_9FUNG|nr:hypothetical protein ATC70_010814 [Mucor velutinosus]